MLVHANGIDIYYKQTGSGRPLLILHGNSENHTKYSGLAEALSREYSVYTPDTRCHGKSTKTSGISYIDMMEDIRAFIAELGLKKPLLIGASDGAITGLLLAINYPSLLSGLIACGANTHPSQLKTSFRVLAKLGFAVTKSPKLRLMLKEPNITPDDLGKIDIPVLVLAGEKDVVSEAVTREIASAIPGSEVKIVPHETHTSYLLHHDRFLTATQKFLQHI